MEKGKGWSLGIAIALMVMVFSQNAQSDILKDFEFHNWKANGNLGEDIGKKDVQLFLDKLLEDADLEIGRESGRLGEYMFVDLNQNGTYELMATLDYSGRAFYGSVVIVTKELEKFRFQELNPFNVTDLKEIIVDLDNDGVKEILITDSFTVYGGGRFAAKWTDVYKWDGKSYKKASKEYRTFYEKRKIKLQEIIRNIQVPDKKAAYEIESEKIQRLLNPESRAGLKRAKEYLKSENDLLKVDAITILEDIGDSESLDLLKKLSKDEDNYISRTSERALKRLQAKQNPKN